MADGALIDGIQDLVRIMRDMSEHLHSTTGTWDHDSCFKKRLADVEARLDRIHTVVSQGA
jgi:hypothetical protein